MTKRAFQEQQRIKPVGMEGIEKIRRIAEEGVAKVNEVLVDSFSASAIIGIYDRLNPECQEKMLSLPVFKVTDISFKLLNKYGRTS